MPVLEPRTTPEVRALLASPGAPILVDFSASWCGPCQALAPVLDAFAAEQGDAVRVLKVDIDTHRALADEVGIRSVPTLLVVRDGAVLDAKAGALGLGALREFVRRALA